MKKKILISAYAISPVRGSEYGAAWNTVINLSRQHELWVLYGMSDAHMGDTETLQQYLKEHTLPNVTFIEVRASRLANAINLLNKAGLGWFFYFAYYLWQKDALAAAQELLTTVDIDVVHQLGPIGYREPGFLSKLNKPFIWGPIGGMKVVDLRMTGEMSVVGRTKFMLKNLINYFQLGYSNRIKEAFSNADVLISATHAGQTTIRERFGRDSYYLSEQGTIGYVKFNDKKFIGIKEQVQLVWCGSLIERKNLTMCLDVLAGIKERNWQLHVLGSGPQQKALLKNAKALNIDEQIIWHGQLPREEAISIIAAAHLHIITSIAEDNPAVVFEAMSYGVPTLTIDHCGMGDVICNRCGIKVLPDSYDVMTKKMKTVLSHLLKNPNILVDMAQSTLGCAEKYQWDKRLTALNQMYAKAVEVHSKPSYYSLNDEILTFI